MSENNNDLRNAEVEEMDTEDEFIKNYDLRRWPSVGATVDLTIFTIRNGKLCVLLIERGGHPEKGKWALPGGFIDITEDLGESAARELKEETGVTIEDGYLEQLHTFGGPNRDRRGYIISVAYVAFVPNVKQPIAGDDAKQAHFFAVEEVLGNDFNLAFDHREIIVKGLDRVRAKIEYSPVAIKFLESESFTISELRNVYEIVWGIKLVPGNFRRKVQSVKGLLEPVGEKRTSEIEGGRASSLFRAGEIETIFPPLRSPFLDPSMADEDF